MNLVFVSNLFPSRDEPVRGLDNATLLPHLLDSGIDGIRVLALRPTLNPARWGARSDLAPRKCDEAFQPRFVGVPYAPKIGSRINHALVEKAASRTLDRFHRECPIDAVLVSWLYPDACGVGRWCSKNGIPFVMVCQGSDAHAYLKRPVRRRLILSTIAKSAAVITRSADLAGRLAEAGAERAKLHPVYNGIDPHVFFPGDSAASRAHLGLPADVPILLFVGNFLPVKNPLLLVEAWKEFAGGRKCALVMIGSGPLESEIKERAGRSADLILPGRLASEEIGHYMRAADVLCLSSHNEGVPNVVLEAFGCGLPVLSTDVGGIGEVLNDGFLGFLVPPGDRRAYVAALGDLTENPRDRKRISTYASKFSWGTAARFYAAILGLHEKSKSGN